MNQISEILYGSEERTTWVIIGASRGIGLEFVSQLLQRGERIFATVRDLTAFHASSLWAQAGSDHGRCQMLGCDVLSEDSINVKNASLFPSSLHLTTPSDLSILSIKATPLAFTSTQSVPLSPCHTNIEKAIRS